ncbi:Seed maturation protein PM41 [Rhynchospora pubera]|uniref:Seed maturation protein PM41 n=1 Tax=Rhynchospora pubera TaxID=906938 RepID=A0AAV8CPR6_9POAL|nr:Seed maturation protein PM41 [Rhynchospora pubera]
MSGAQGAQPKGSFTATTYHSQPQPLPAATQDQPKMALLSTEDEPGVPVDKLEDKVKDAAGLGGPVFGAGSDDAKPDLGVAGTG